MLRPVSLLVALQAAACATIPSLSASRFATKAAGVPLTIDLAPCVLVAGSKDLPLLAGIDALSLETWHQAYAAVVIHHPKGMVVIDAPFGRTINSDLAHAPFFLHVAFGTGAGKKPTAGLLFAAGIDPSDVSFALVTHAHWDHVGGLRDMPTAKVLLSKIDFDWARKQPVAGNYVVMPWNLWAAKPRIEPFDLDGAPYQGFASSHDLFGDGSIVAVPLPGHTPGSVGYFVNSSSGKRWLFSGDASWTLEGIRRPALKNIVVRAIVDDDEDKTAESVAALHALQSAAPDVQIVPSHDLDAVHMLPPCGATQSKTP